MTKKEFDNVVEQRIKKIRTVLKDKQAEYAPGDDAFHNFKEAGRILGTSPEMALMGFMSKHLTSLLDMAKGQQVMTKANIDEKCGDVVNYLILLEGIMLESCGVIPDLGTKGLVDAMLCSRCNSPKAPADQWCPACTEELDRQYESSQGMDNGS